MSSTLLPEHDRSVLAELVAELAADPTTLGVCLFGSWAAGRARPDSDVDLLRIVEGGRCAKTKRLIDGRVFEVVDQEPGPLRASLAAPGLRNHCFIANVAAAIEVLFDRDGRVAALVAEARAARLQGPPAVKPLEAAIGRSVMRSKLDKVRALVRGPDPHGLAPVMTHVLFLLLLGAYCKGARRWFNRLPLLLDEIQREDGGFYLLCRRHLDASTANEKLEGLERIVEHVVALGGPIPEQFEDELDRLGRAAFPAAFFPGDGPWAGF